MIDGFFKDIANIPYKLGGRDSSGMDCWGLLVIAYVKLFSIELPSYADTVWAVSKSGLTSEDIKQHIACGEIFSCVDIPRYGDMVLLNIMGNPVHIGMMLNDKIMIHTSNSTGIATEDIRGVKWKRRVQGFYRHKRLL